MRSVIQVFLILCAILLVMIPPNAYRTAAQEGDSTGELVDRLIASLTPAERVGQLVLVTFEGSNVKPDTEIAQLIRNYNIGGVVLLAENDNINGHVNTPRLVQSLTTELQQLAYDGALATSERPTPREYIPLFITTTHAGNGQPDTQIAVGTTPLPSYMAIGATWNAAFARQVGQIAGSELSAMGINMLLGPPLDVAQQPQAERTLDLGVNTFGGEPYWVGKMGQAYVTGVHEGSQGRIAVIAQNFPGLGFADSQPDYEIPVVPRTVAELQQLDLMPFHVVTGGAPNDAAQADGIQCANIRYQGENVRSITGPVCVDEQAAARLLAIDAFIEWRKTGIMVSSPLGSRAIRRYYGVTPLPHRQVAREAFLAGNDLLYLTDFGPNPGDPQISNVLDVIDFFAERYEDDPVFRERVDQSLQRILTLKLRLYDGDLSIDNVLTPVTDIDGVGSEATLARLYPIAEQGVTLLSPRRESLPPPPARHENIIIFTDVQLVQQCSYCATYPQVSVNALEVAVERMYGPFAGAIIRPEQVISFSFTQLQSYLNGEQSTLSSESNQFKTIQRIGEALREADWIVFVMQDVSPDRQESLIVRHLIETDSSIVDQARVVIVALGPPTYLSATEISKFAAYLGLYSNTPPYIDAAARALFQESSFPGAPPISIPALGYNVFDMTAPDPNQILRIEVVAVDDTPLPQTESEVLTVNVGQQLQLRTGPILDRNGHPVPDRTPVDFTVTFVTDNLQTRQHSETEDGIAATVFRPARPGRIQITVSTDNASRSETLQIVVSEDIEIPLIAAPDLPSTTTAQQALGTLSDSQALEDGEAASIESTSDSPPASLAAPNRTSQDTPDDLDIRDFALALSGLALLSVLGFFAGRVVTLTMGGGIRVLLGCVVSGLTGYIYYGVGGPGSEVLNQNQAAGGALIVTMLSGLIGLVYTWALLRRGQ